MTYRYSELICKDHVGHHGISKCCLARLQTRKKRERKRKKKKKKNFHAARTGCMDQRGETRSATLGVHSGSYCGVRTVQPGAPGPAPAAIVGTTAVQMSPKLLPENQEDPGFLRQIFNELI